jgi:hypothetical protein
MTTAAKHAAAEIRYSPDRPAPVIELRVPKRTRPADLADDFGGVLTRPGS